MLIKMLIGKIFKNDTNNTKNVTKTFGNMHYI